MARFFSYPYNYLELSEYTKKGTEESMKAAKVSDNNHDSFVEITDDESINFTFRNQEGKKIDAIFVLAIGIESITIPSNSPISELSLISGLSKQYIFKELDTSITDFPLELTFSKDSSVEKAKIYEIFLLEKKAELTYTSPEKWDSSFSEVDLVHTQEGLGIHEDIYGHQMEYRQYGYRPKYKISYTAPLQTLEQVRNLQRFREDDDNLNFTFVQDIETYPERVLPCHFSDYSLPISYTLPHLAQEERYTIQFTIMEN